jgi:hypothetical protein
MGSIDYVIRPKEVDSHLLMIWCDQSLSPLLAIQARYRALIKIAVLIYARAEIWR